MHTARIFTRIQLKAVDTAQRVIEGYAAAFSNKDRVGDVIAPGAFDRTLKEGGDVVALVGHDASRLPVGEPIEMRADAKGLFTRTRIYATASGDELLTIAAERLASGKTLGMSIGYKTRKDAWATGDDGTTVRKILDLDLVEYSYLASPDMAANPRASVLAVKQRQRKQAGGTSLLEGSYEDLQGDLAEAGRRLFGTYGIAVCATYPDHVVFCVMEGMGPSIDSESDYAASDYWDVPYTLGDDGEPELGEPVPVQAAFVPGAAKALAKLQEERRVTVDVKAEWTASYINDLPDSAFAYIAPGGDKDSEGKTTPRSLRKFPHHDANGKLDVPHLRNALSRAPQSPDGEKALAHLERHAKANDVGKARPPDDAHEPAWQDGAAPRVLVASLKMAELADDLVVDRLAMERLGIDTKKGTRLNSAMRKRLKDLHAQIGEIIAWAESVDSGEDGKALVDRYRANFDFMELEVAAA